MNAASQHHLNGWIGRQWYISKDSSCTSLPPEVEEQQSKKHILRFNNRFSIVMSDICWSILLCASVLISPRKISAMSERPSISVDFKGFGTVLHLFFLSFETFILLYVSF